MKDKDKVLWIEDGALGDLPDLLAPINVNGRYDLQIAVDATEGIERIMQSEFKAVIVDIRLPPGDDKRWISIYNSPRNVNAARLGIVLLRSLLKPAESEVQLNNIPHWVRPQLFGVLTVENQNEVETDLEDLGIEVYRQKNRRPSPNTLLELIKEVMGRAGAGGNK